MAATPPITARSTLGQVLPPLALFLPLLVTDISLLAVAVAAVLLALAIALARLARHLVRRPPPGTRRLRSVLTVCFALATLALTWLELAPTARYVNGLAGAVQVQCRHLGKCPARIGGWTDVAGGSDNALGNRVRTPLAYRTDGTSFRVCWQVAFGRCRSARGGVSAPLERVQPLPWPQLGAAGAPPAP